MATNKDLRMSDFYSQCCQKGYTDMTDENIQLKAKVIATDLKLYYGSDIAAFFEKAKICYEKVENEKAEEEKRRKELIEEKARKDAMQSELILTLADSKNKIEVYLREDNSVYHTFNGGKKLEGAPEISATEKIFYQTTHNPSQAVYTGATVGGITTGGIHHTQESYSQKGSKSGKGEILAKAYGVEKAIVLRKATASKMIQERFKHHPTFKFHFSKQGICLCYDEKSEKLFSDSSSLLAGKSTADMMTTVSVIAVSKCLDFDDCKSIKNILKSIVSLDFPPTDEELYESALKASESNNSSDLFEALQIFNSILYYKDSRVRAREVQIKHEEVLQREKEEKVIRREKLVNKTKKVTKISVIAIVATVIFCIIATILFTYFKKASTYSKAMQLVEDKQYEEAIELFSEIKTFRDSEDMITEANYLEAKFAFENKNYGKSRVMFQKLKDYKDSNELEKESQYLLGIMLLEDGKYQIAKDHFESLGDYKDSETKYKETVYQIAKEYYDKELFGIALKEFTKIKDYSDAATYIENISYVATQAKIYYSEPVIITYDEDGKMSSAKNNSYTFRFDAKGRITEASTLSQKYHIEYQNDGTAILLLNDKPSTLFDKYGNAHSRYNDSNPEPQKISGYSLDEHHNATNGLTNEYDDNGNLLKSEGSLRKNYALKIEYEYTKCKNTYKSTNENNIRIMFNIVYEDTFGKDLIF